MFAAKKSKKFNLPTPKNKYRRSLKKRTLTIGTWNVHGLGNKMNDLLSVLKKTDQDIIVLTETKKNDSGIEFFDEYAHVYSGVLENKTANGGVSILLKQKYKKDITDWNPVNENILTINVDVLGMKLSLIGVYGIGEDESQSLKDEFYQKLNMTISNIEDNREIILLGDLNARVGRKTANEIVGPHGEDVCNNNGERFTKICNQRSLKILNGFFPHKSVHKYTWHQDSLGILGIIDYIVVRQQTRMKIQDVRTFRGHQCGSDHYLLNSKILIPFPSESTHRKTVAENVE